MMSTDDLADEPGERAGEQSLRCWYKRHCAFEADMAAETGLELAQLSFDEFKNWWERLPEKTRLEQQAHYKKGWDSLISERTEALINHVQERPRSRG